MHPEITISPAAHADLPAMIHIACEALEVDILTAFLYSPHPREAARQQTEALTVSLGKRFTAPTNRCHILKATSVATGALLGWILVRWEDGRPREPIYSGAAPTGFLQHYAQEVRKNWARTGIPERPHVVLGALYVQSRSQRGGVGRRLVEHIYSEYNLHDELVIVQTRGMSEGFYHRLGWETVDSTDIDLSVWGGSGRGYGVHRSPQLVRRAIGQR